MRHNFTFTLKNDNLKFWFKGQSDHLTFLKNNILFSKTSLYVNNISINSKTQKSFKNSISPPFYEKEIIIKRVCSHC